MAAKYQLKQYVNKFRSTRVKSLQYNTATNGDNIVISVHKITLRIVIDCFPHVLKAYFYIIIKPEKTLTK